MPKIRWKSQKSHKPGLNSIISGQSIENFCGAMASRVTVLDPLFMGFRELPKPPIPKEKNRIVEISLPKLFS